MYRKRAFRPSLLKHGTDVLGRQVESSNLRQLDVTQFAYASTSPSNENTTGVYLETNNIRISGAVTGGESPSQLLAVIMGCHWCRFAEQYEIPRFL